MKNNNGPMSKVESAKISEGKVAHLNVTDTTITTTRRIHTLAPSDRAATGVNNTKTKKKKNVMVSSIANYETS